MPIEKYSIVKLISENKIGYVQDVINGKLKLSNHNVLIEDNSETVRLINFDDISTEELVEVSRQIKILNMVYIREIQRRVYDVQKRKSKSPWFGDNFEPKR